jgi:hypothetical protein
MSADTGLTGPGWFRAALGWGGILLHVAVGVFPYSASGLLAPWYGIVLLWACWAALLVAALRLRPRRPLWVPAVPVAAIVLWWPVLSLGENLLGWTA